MNKNFLLELVVVLFVMILAVVIIKTVVGTMVNSFNQYLDSMFKSIGNF